MYAALTPAVLLSGGPIQKGKGNRIALVFSKIVKWEPTCACNILGHKCTC